MVGPRRRRGELAPHPLRRSPDGPPRRSAYTVPTMKDVAATPVLPCSLAPLFALACTAGLCAQTWAPPITSSVAYYAERASTMLDIDRDGNPDLVTVDGSAITPLLSYQYGDGHGGFGPRQYLATAPLATGVVSADLDYDGYADLVVSGPISSRVHYGNAQGVVGPAVSFPGILAPVAVDIDHDGCVDLVGSESGVTTCKVVFGDGHRGFSRSVSLTLTPGFLPSLTVVMDLDGDGGDEVVFLSGNSTGRYLQVLGNGSGGTLAVEPPVSLGTVGFSRGAVADWDGDGSLDLLLPRGGGGYPTHEIQILRHQLRSFDAGQTLTTVPIALGVTLRQVFATDLDGDGVLDLLCANSGGDMLTAKGRGNGALDPWVTQAGHLFLFPQFVDVTRDGVPDLVQPWSTLIETHAQNGTSQPGAVAYGFGTETCLGSITIGIDSPPVPGNAAMRLRFANAPPRARGLVFGGGPQDVPGHPHQLGVLLHTGQELSITLGIDEVDSTGVMTMAMPVPNEPSLYGTVVYMQGLFRGDFANGLLCEGAATGIVSSLGLAVTVQ